MVSEFLKLNPSTALALKTDCRVTGLPALSGLPGLCVYIYIYRFAFAFEAQNP